MLQAAWHYTLHAFDTKHTKLKFAHTGRMSDELATAKALLCVLGASELVSSISFVAGTSKWSQNDLLIGAHESVQSS